MTLLNHTYKYGKRICSLLLFLCLFVPSTLLAARLKDIAEIEGVRENQLLGYGLVVGLNGTGDKNKVPFTKSAVANMMERLGIRVEPEDLKLKNAAGVIVTATLPPFTRPGMTIDAHVASLGDAKSLVGGTLLFTQLQGADGNVYAVAQGSLSVGGFSIEAGNDAAIQNHPTSALVPSGAIVERSLPFDLFQSGKVRIVLREADFVTLNRVVAVINETFNRPLAVAIDAASLEIRLAGNLARDPIGFVAQLEEIEVTRDVRARIVVNEKTGTVVIGHNVTIGEVAVAHGNLNVTIRSETQVSQPPPLAEGGETTLVTNNDVSVAEELKQLNLVAGVTLSQVVDALNALGASPRDLISILTAIKAGGGLNAELILL